MNGGGGVNDLPRHVIDFARNRFPQKPFLPFGKSQIPMFL